MTYRPASVSDTPRESYDPHAPRCEVQWVSSGSIYRGSGIEPASHPAAQGRFGQLLRSIGCGRCNSVRLSITYLKHSAHPFSGDEYWDFEARCHDCGAFNWYTGQD